jgi:ferrous iron transport protein A
MALPTDPPTPVLKDDIGVPLSSLARGDRAIVLDVDASTPEGRRLLELGFLPETEIRVVRRAPLGDPIAFYLRGAQICLRHSEAARIRVLAVHGGSET